MHVLFQRYSLAGVEDPEGVLYFGDQGDARPPDMVMSVLDFSCAYGNEFVGSTTASRVFVTPLMQRSLVVMMQSLRGMSSPYGAAVCGATGTGKAQTVGALAAALGMHLLPIACSTTMQAPALGWLLTGLGKSGSWAYFSDLWSLATPVAAVFAQMLRKQMLRYHQAPSLGSQVSPVAFAAFASFDSQAVFYGLSSDIRIQFRT